MVSFTLLFINDLIFSKFNLFRKLNKYISVFFSDKNYSKILRVERVQIKLRFKVAKGRRVAGGHAEL